MEDWFQPNERTSLNKELTYFTYLLNLLTSLIRSFKPHVIVYSAVCVEPGRKPRRQVFSRRGSIM